MFRTRRIWSIDKNWSTKHIFTFTSNVLYKRTTLMIDGIKRINISDQLNVSYDHMRTRSHARSVIQTTHWDEKFCTAATSDRNLIVMIIITHPHKAGLKNSTVVCRWLHTPPSLSTDNGVMNIKDSHFNILRDPLNT